MKTVLKGLLSLAQSTASIISSSSSAILIAAPSYYSFSEIQIQATHIEQVQNQVQIQAQLIETAEQNNSSGIQNLIHFQLDDVSSLNHASDTQDVFTLVSENIAAVNSSNQSQVLGLTKAIDPLMVQNSGIQLGASALSVPTLLTRPSLLKSGLISQQLSPSSRQVTSFGNKSSSMTSSTKAARAPASSTPVAASSVPASSTDVQSQNTQVRQISVASISPVSSTTPVNIKDPLPTTDSDGANSGDTSAPATDEGSSNEDYDYTSQLGVCSSGAQNLDLQFLQQSPHLLVSHPKRTLVTKLGEIFVLGQKDQTWQLQKFHADGSADQSWAKQSLFEYEVAGSSEVSAISADKNGNILIAGAIRNSQRKSDYKEKLSTVVVKVNSTGQIDDRFSNKGVLSFAVINADERPYYLYHLRNGSFVMLNLISSTNKESKLSFLRVLHFDQSGVQKKSSQGSSSSYITLYNITDNFASGVDLVELQDGGIAFSTVDQFGSVSVYKLNSNYHFDKKFNRVGSVKLGSKLKQNSSVALEESADHSSLNVIYYANAEIGFKSMSTVSLDGGRLNFSQGYSHAQNYCRVGHSFDFK